MLHGMADQLKHAAADAKKGLGLRVREYVPVGEMIPGMAYLVRRLLENTSNESWLRAGFLDEANEDVLLAAPGPKMPAARTEPARGDAAHPQADPHLISGTDLKDVAAERHKLSPAPEGVGDGKPFINEPLRDFAEADQREAFAAAIERTNVRGRRQGIGQNVGGIRRGRLRIDGLLRLLRAVRGSFIRARTPRAVLGRA